MLDEIIIEPMTKDFFLWRCLHGGPLTRETVDQPVPHPQVPWAELRARNLPLLERLTDLYGACAIVARDGEAIVGQLRFYPKALHGMAGAGGLCLQQTFPAGAAGDFAQSDFPPFASLADKTLTVRCLMTGSPHHADHPYQRQGIGTRMARTLLDWARMHGWQAIEALGYEDLPILYQYTGQAGKRFWEKLGFQIADTCVEPLFEQDTDFVRTMRSQATTLGRDPEMVKYKYLMRSTLT